MTAPSSVANVIEMAARRELRLGVDGFAWPDLHRPEGLARLHDAFEAWLAERDAVGLELLRQHRADPDRLSPTENSALMIRLAPFVGAFLARLFGVEREVDAAREALLAEEPVFRFKKHFVKRRVLAKGAGQAWKASVDEARALTELVCRTLVGPRDEDEERWTALGTLQVADALDVARKVARSGGASWTDELAARVAALRAALAREPSGAPLVALDDEGLLATLADAIEAALVARRSTPGDPARHWPSLRDVHKQDFERLVPLRVPRDAVRGEVVGDVHARTRVEPFALTDARGEPRQVASEVDYCLDCHEREKDSCSRGMRDKGGNVAKNPLGAELAGCPLDEKIGEAHVLRRQGELLGALAVITVDNPMCPGTGHRICNDCMKACVYQKQEPVNIPLVETRTLDDVLALPFGFEIWSLLTRFNPLAVRRPHALPYNGKKVLVVGLGPAGYTLAHYLVNEGFGVVAVDGLKVEPLPDELTGLDGRVPRPVRDVGELREPLDRRTVLGFGGVSEYGITVRWDKSFLKMLYLNLARRSTFRVYGGVRFGGTLTLEDAFALGIDHVAIAAGAGKPTLVSMKNGLLRGIRTASDFLMALQLSGAFQRGSLANLQVRLPALVIGSGLTAIDTATELLAYYVVQSEKVLARYETLCDEHGEARVRARFDAEELAILDESVAHGRAIRAERELAAREAREPRFAELLDAWGGVRIVYRRRMVESPAYRLNHEEVTKSLEEGVRYVELLAPVDAHPDEHGAVRAVTFERQEADESGRLRGSGELVELPARAVFIAAGTKPNVTYERELPGTFALDERGFFANHVARVADDGTVSLEPSRGGGFFTSYLKDGRTVSYYGDNHPRYAGSVVKAMASAKDGHGRVVELFARHIAGLEPSAQPARDAAWATLVRTLDDQLTATVREVRRLAPSIVEVVVYAPRAAQRFRPGQFYRLQTFDRFAPRVDGTTLTMEGLALTGAWTDPERGLLSLIVLEMGASSRLCAHLTEGEPVVVMGPTGRPTEIAPGESVLLAGGGLGNAVLFSIARAFRDAGSKVLYFAGYRRGDMLFKQEEIEAATDQVVWAVDEGPAITPRRPQDRFFHGNIVQAMLAYAKGELGPRAVELAEVDRVLAIGSDGMMNAVARARHGVLEPYLKPGHRAIGSINSPMQCMMKEVCAQCLQRQVDPLTGEERMVYSCFDQDQPLDRVDFAHLRQRLRQSSVQEKLADMWYARLARTLKAAAE
jgi:NADPH-dependent glutamate synthase beta subunit-like oxidoreductase/NAD(P)H-flavin reductase